MTTGITYAVSRHRCAAETPTPQNKLPQLSEDDRRRLLREWADANARGDLDARRRVKAEILGKDPAGTADDGSDHGGL